jgi:hypothetical protein
MVSQTGSEIDLWFRAKTHINLKIIAFYPALVSPQPKLATWHHTSSPSLTRTHEPLHESTNDSCLAHE